jgi:uncharacterized membrane protein
MESVSGLPAHPLFVHAPVVLVPLATLLALACATWPRLRRRAGWAVAGAAAVGLIATQLAVSSGYRFDELLEGAVDTSDHQALGETTRNLVAVFLVSAMATAWLDRPTGDPATGLRRWAVVAGVVVTTLSSVMATVWMIRTGEEGARLVWDGVLTARLR